MKKNSWIFVLFCVIALLFSFSGCGGDDPAPPGPVAPSSVALNKSTLALQVGATSQLTATVLPDSAENKGVMWDSSNEDVATVSATGLVTAIAVGEALITVTTVDGGKLDTCEVTVTLEPPPVVLALEIEGVGEWSDGIYLKDSELHFVVGDKISLEGVALNDFPTTAASGRFFFWANGAGEKVQTWFEPDYLKVIETPEEGDTLDFNVTVRASDLAGPGSDQITPPQSSWDDFKAMIIGLRSTGAKMRIDNIVVERGTDVIWSLQDDFLDGKEASDTALVAADVADTPLGLYTAGVIVKIIEVED